LLLLAITATADAAPGVSLELRDVSPEARTPVPLNTPVYGHIVYSTDTPVRLELRPYRNGQPVLEGVHHSRSPEYAGSGEAIAWFSVSSPQTIDEIRAVASDPRGIAFAHASLKRAVTWRPGTATDPAAPSERTRLPRLLRQELEASIAPR